MANIKYTDSDGEERYSYSTHAGTDIDPDESPEQIVDAIGTGNTALAAIKTAVELLDNAVSDNEIQVDVVSMPTVAVTGTFYQATQPVSGTFWQATQPVSGTVAVTGVATETTLAAVNGKLPALGQALAAASVPVILPAATVTTLTPPAAITGFATSANQTAEAALIGAVTETAPGTDTASSGLNGRLQRVAQLLTTLLTRWPAALGGTTSANSLPVSLSTDGPFASLTGALTETAPASDTASSGANGRLQRIAQNITTMSAKLPAALNGNGNLKTAVQEITLPTTIYNGNTNVTTAGTRVVLAASQAILSGVTIKAKAANTGVIYVGSSTVAAANGYALAAGESVFLEIANLNTVNLDSSVNGEGVTYLAS